MPNKKISELPSLSLESIVPTTDIIPVVNSGSTKKATIVDVVRSASSHMFNVKNYGVSPSRSASFNRATIQDLIDEVYDIGGGQIWFPEIVEIDDSLYSWQRVWLHGVAPGYVNPYTSLDNEPTGGGIFVASGSNCDALIFRCRLYNDGGTLREVTHDRKNTDARHWGGAVNLMVWGNRSTDQLPTVADLNTSGSGIVLEGVRGTELHNVTGMYCAEDGIQARSYNYGTGDISTNNTKLVVPNALSNNNNGIYIAGGDNVLVAPNCGYNGETGLLLVTSGTLTGGQSWNNFAHGCYALNANARAILGVVGLSCYDNNNNGIRLGGAGGYGTVVQACTSRGNGRDTGAIDADRANYRIGSGVAAWSLAACHSQATSQDGVLTARYDYYIDNSTYAGSIDGITWDKTAPAPLGNNITSATNLITHGEKQGISHPGVAFTGTVDMGIHTLIGVKQLGFAQWASKAINAGVVDAGSDSLITITPVAAPTDVTDLTATASSGLVRVTFRNAGVSAVTFKHNTSKLRNTSGADVVLQPSLGTISYIWLSGAIWMQD